MNIKEYEDKLRSLNPDEFQKFNSDFGGGDKSVEQRVREFLDDPKHEGRICQLLGLETEADKLTMAALDSAKSAVQSSKYAKISIVIATIALLLTIAQAIVNSPFFYDSYKKTMLLVNQGNGEKNIGKNIFIISNPGRSKIEDVEIKLAIKQDDTARFLITDRKIGNISYSEMKDHKGNSLSFLKVTNITFEKLLPGEFISIFIEEGVSDDNEIKMINDSLPAVISAVHSEGFAQVNASYFSFN